jgi:hypothetical protein
MGIQKTRLWPCKTSCCRPANLRLRTCRPPEPPSACIRREKQTLRIACWEQPIGSADASGPSPSINPQASLRGSSSSNRLLKIHFGTPERQGCKRSESRGNKSQDNRARQAKRGRNPICPHSAYPVRLASLASPALPAYLAGSQRVRPARPQRLKQAEVKAKVERSFNPLILSLNLNLSPNLSLPTTPAGAKLNEPALFSLSQAHGDRRKSVET